MVFKAELFWLSATAIFVLGVLTALTIQQPEPPISAWRFDDHIQVKVRNVVVDVPSKEEVPGVFVVFPDKSIQYVPLTARR